MKISDFDRINKGTAVTKESTTVNTPPAKLNNVTPVEEAKKEEKLEPIYGIDEENLEWLQHVKKNNPLLYAKLQHMD